VPVKTAVDLQQGSETHGPLVALEDILCGPRLVLGIFI